MNKETMGPNAHAQRHTQPCKRSIVQAIESVVSWSALGASLLPFDVFELPFAFAFIVRLWFGGTLKQNLLLACERFQLSLLIAEVNKRAAQSKAHEGADDQQNNA